VTVIKRMFWLVPGALFGALTLLALQRWVLPVVGPGSTLSRADQAEPLYWVAPMDPNYRRDQPGKSPMGMDMVPVYADEQGGADATPGTVRISPDVVNNLGVRTGLAQRQPLQNAIQTVGYVRFDEDKLIHIHPRVDGWVEKLYVKAEGDPVEQRQPLYDLYAPALVNAQEEMVLALQRDSTRLIEAAEVRLRALQLSSGVIKRLRQTQRVQQTITFYAPQSGVIDSLAIREGFYVQPGTTLMSIGALDEVWVEAEVFERQAAQVAVGAAVTMTLDYLPGRRWQGAVDYVYPALDQRTRTVRVRMRFANDDLVLKPNMFAQVSIQVRSDGEALVIPREALIRTGNMDRVVLSLGEGRFRSVVVTTGRSDDSRVEILQGLADGDEVVTSAQFLIDSESSKTADLKRIDHSAQPAMPITEDSRRRRVRP
jgi:Cu(I)/Ag(I) efflux system membrane fusion protein